MAVNGQPHIPGVVGRTREIDALRSGIADAFAGRTQLFMLTGEAGIGKTRLASVAADIAGLAGGTAMWGRCWEAGGAPAYWPWVQIFRGLARRAGAQRDEWMGPGAAYLAQIDPAIASPATDASSPDPAQARFAMFDAATEFLNRASDHTPLALVLDDLHVADVPSLLLLQFVVRTLRDARVVILGTHRDVSADMAADAAPLLSEIGKEARTFRLGGLDRDDVGALIAGTAGMEASDHVVRQVHALTDGNPFFVDELARLLASEGQLEGATGVTIPEGVRDTVAKRVSQLPQETRVLLATASVAGREFSIDLLRHVGQGSRAQLMGQLRPAEDARLISESMGRHIFSHAIVRETLYAAIPASERARIHRRLAEVIERFGDPDEDIAEIAHHWFAAARDGDPGPAAEYSRRAGRRAMSMLAFEDAVAGFNRALQALSFEASPNERTRCQILVELGDAQRCAGRTGDARATLVRAAALARGLNDGELLAQAVLGIGAILSGGVWTRAWTTDTELTSLAEDAINAIGDKDSAMRARLMARLGADFHFSPRREEGIALAREAVRIAERLRDDDTLAFCLTALHAAIWAPDTGPERLKLATEMVRLAEKAGNQEIAMTGHIWRHTDLLELGRIDEAEAEADAYLAMADQSRRPQFRAYADMVRSARLYFQGRVHEAAELSERAWEYGDRYTEDIISNSALFQLAESLSLIDATRAGTAIARQSLPNVNPSRAMRAKAAALSGDAAEARSLLSSLVTEKDIPIDRDAFFTSAVPHLAVTAVALNDRVRAEAILRVLEPLQDINVIAGRNGVTRAGPMTLFLAGCATVIGDFDAAARYAADARARAEVSGSPVWIVLACLEELRVLTRRNGAGDSDAAAEVFDRVLEIAERHRLDEVARTARRMMDAIRQDTTNTASLIREGEFWTVGYGGDVARLKHVRGLEHLAALIAYPDREIHALELTAGPDAVPATDAGPMLDEEAKAAYRKRLLDAQSELEEAEDFNDPERAARMREEIDAITRELAAGIGLGGRDRPMDSATERARIAVTKALKTAVDRIAKALPGLGEHLRASVKTGTFCSYSPGGTTLSWRL